MTNAAQKPFELIFVGGIPPREARWIEPPVTWEHETYESARDEAYRILLQLSERKAHPAIIYGPGCGKDGRTIP
jgi:hypothetical protein